MDQIGGIGMKKQPEYQGAGWAIHNSDCIEGMHAMPEHSIDLTIFSPPFGDLFVYSDSERDSRKRWHGAGVHQPIFLFFADALTRVMKPGRMTCVHCTDLPITQGPGWVHRVAMTFPGI
jgi:hypothetical protein